MAKSQTILEVAGRGVTITNPDKIYFPHAGHTKLDLAKYYVAVAEGSVRGIASRPIVLKRYVNGADQEPFFQKRAPEQHPEWIETVELRFPSGRTASEIVVRDAAQLLWIVNLGCIDLNPHPVRDDDLDHLDELRIDLDPGPGVSWEDVRAVTMVVRDVLDEHGLRGWPKTSGSRGMHVFVRIERRWGFDDVRRAALALAREIERRVPERATSKWWKEERHGVFLDYNQNAKDRTVASAWSVRPTADARVSMPLQWDEVRGCDPAAFTLLTAPARLSERGDAGAGIDDVAGSLHGLLALAESQAAAGMADAPWPPHYRKGRDEPTRAAPSRRKSADTQTARTAHAPRPPALPKPRQPGATGRRKASQALITVAKAEHRDAAMAGLERWKALHPEAAAHLQVDDVLVDAMRGRSTTWTRIRLNLRHVPVAQRPAEEPPDPDYDPWRRFRDHTVGRPLVLDLDHRPLAGAVGRGEPLGHDAVESRSLESLEPVFRQSAIERRGREVNRGLRALEHALESLAAHGQRRLAQVLVADREQIPGHERRRRLLGQHLHARGSGMDAQQQRLEVETAGTGDHDLAVDHATRGQRSCEWLEELREIAVHRLGVAALEHDLVAVAEHHGAEAVPFGLELPALPLWQGFGRVGQHGLERGVEGQAHVATTGAG